MLSHKLFLLAVSALLLSGCATNPAIESLTDSKRNDVIVISQPISHKKTSGLANVVTEYGLLPGIYRPYKENELGAFYLGDGRATWMRSYARPNMPYHLSKGGVWLPTGNKGKVLLFVIGEGHDYQYDGAIGEINAKSMPEVNAKDSVQNSAYAKSRIDQAVNPTTNNAKPNLGSATGNVIGFAIADAIIEASNQAAIGKLFMLDGSDNPEFEKVILDSLRNAGSP